jgi:hypothetical protein
MDFEEGDKTMSVALWCEDCLQVVERDQHGNCAVCSSPQTYVRDRPNLDQRTPVNQARLTLALLAAESERAHKYSGWLLTILVLILIYGIGLCIWAYSTI